MREWSGDASFSVHRLYEQHRRNGLPPHNVGACKSGNKKDTPVSHLQKRTVAGYCVEPMKMNFDMLNRSLHTLGYTQNITLTKAAASMSGGLAWMPFGWTGQGNQQIQLNTNIYNHQGGEEVRVISLDEYIRDDPFLQTHTIDWLSIDTEGHDARVLFGGVNAFRHRKITALEFEYHEIGPWKQTNLSQAIVFLSLHGLDCYWELNDGRVIPLTQCWHERYDAEKRWSNLMCGLRGSVLSRMLEELANELFGNWKETSPS